MIGVLFLTTGKVYGSFMRSFFVRKQSVPIRKFIRLLINILYNGFDVLGILRRIYSEVCFLEFALNLFINNLLLR